MVVLHSFADLDKVAIKTVSPPTEQTTKPLHSRSWSSRIKEYIAGLSDDVLFMTAGDIADAVGCSYGAASGYVHHLMKYGVASNYGFRNDRVLWRIDRKKAARMYTKYAPGRGSVKGHTKNGSARIRPEQIEQESKNMEVTQTEIPVAPAKEVVNDGGYDVISALLEAAAYLEAHKPTLADFTTQELVDELHRRVHTEK